MGLFDERFRLGSFPLLGGLTVNDVVSDRRDTEGLLPADTSLREIGGLFSALPQAFDVGTMANGIVEAINTPVDPNEPYGQFKRLGKLFPQGIPFGRPAKAAARLPGTSEIPVGAAVAPAEEMVFSGPKAQFQAQDQWKAWGGKGNARVEKRGPDTFVAVRETPDPGAVTAAPGGLPGLAPGPLQSGRKPLPASPFMDRRGLPGREPAGPRSAVVGTDPEGRPLYADSVIAGIRQPGGPNVPVSPLEEEVLANVLGNFTRVSQLPGANGQVRVRRPGEMGYQWADVPPTAPLLDIDVTTSAPGSVLRHEGGHALDYWTERTQRGAGQMNQKPIPADVLDELEPASKEMRPDLWGPDAPRIYQRAEQNIVDYRHRPDELMADGYRYYKEDPEGFKAKYPNAAAYIRAMVNDDPLLSGFVQFNAKTNPTVGLLTGALANAKERSVGHNLFDLSNLSQVPDVPQTQLERYVPARGVSERAQALDDPKVIRTVNKYVDQGLKEGGAEWYNAEPLRKAFIDQLGMEEGQKSFALYMNMVAATSPRSKVPDNIRNASYYYGLLKRGEPLPEAPPLPQPYGHKAQNLHVQNAHTVASPEGWNLMKNPKPPSFANNLMGNQLPVTVDAHNVRAWGILSKDPRWISLQNAEDPTRRPRDMVAAGTPVEDLRPSDYASIPNPNEYGAMEKMQQRLAKKKGLSPAQYQAALWVGARQVTGMESPPVSFMELLEQRIQLTAKKRGLPETEVLRKFISGEQPLLAVTGPPVGGLLDEDEKKKPLTEAQVRDML